MVYPQYVYMIIMEIGDYCWMEIFYGRHVGWHSSNRLASTDKSPGGDGKNAGAAPCRGAWCDVWVLKSLGWLPFFPVFWLTGQFWGDYHHHMFGNPLTISNLTEWQRVWTKHFEGYPADIPGHGRGFNPEMTLVFSPYGRCSTYPV